MYPLRNLYQLVVNRQLVKNPCFLCLNNSLSVTGNFCPYEVVLITIDKQPHVGTYPYAKKPWSISLDTVAYIQLSYFRFCMPIIWLNLITAKDTHENYQTTFFLHVGGDALLPEKSHGRFHVCCMCRFFWNAYRIWRDASGKKIKSYSFVCMVWRSLSITSPRDAEHLKLALGENFVPIAYAIGS